MNICFSLGIKEKSILFKLVSETFTNRRYDFFFFDCFDHFFKYKLIKRGKKNIVTRKKIFI